MENPQASFFDGASNRKHLVTLKFGTDLEILEAGRCLARWPYADIHRQDAGDGILRLSATTASPLARLEIADQTMQHAIVAACPALYGQGSIGTISNLQIVGWSLAAVVSLLAIIFLGVPLIAERLTSLIPHSVERRLGEAVDGQMRQMFGGRECKSEPGVAAFSKLMAALESKAGLPYPPRPVVLSSKVPNAFALPGGNIYLLEGLLDKADSPDEVAGVLAHELGHVAHRDGLRLLIQNGGTSFLAGLLFGDVTGASVVLTLGRTLVSARYSRAAEAAADSFASGIMNGLGRSPRPMGELLIRLTGTEKDDPLAIFASHPLTADRMAAFENASAATTGPEILNSDEWHALKSICK